MFFSKIRGTRLKRSETKETAHFYFLMSQQESVSAVSSGGGNTNNPTARLRSVTMTVNNYTPEEESQMSQLAQRSKEYCIGKEVSSTGTPHLQAYFHFKNQIRFSTLKKMFPRAHIEKARGSAQDNLRYCSKDGDFQTNIIKKWTIEEMKELVRAEYTNVVWRPWQQDVLDILAAPVCPRTIHWVFESSGNTGKSYLCKFLCLEPSTVLCSGKSSDILHAVAKAIEAGLLPRVVLFDIPRVSQEYVSFQALESLKNGCAMSGKYEGTQILIPSPHIICFSNSMPSLEKLSKDRWMIYEIKHNTLYEKLI